MMYREKLNTLSKIASFLRAPRKKFIERFRCEDEQNPLVVCKDVYKLNRYHIYCSSHVQTYNTHLLHYDRFITGKIWEEWNKAKASVHHDVYDHLVMTFRLSSLTCVMGIIDEYHGVGGVFLRANDANQGFFIEPIANWLQGVVGNDPVFLDAD